MWEANVRTIVSDIIANLRQVKPDCEHMASTVSDLVLEVGTQNLPHLIEPSASAVLLNDNVCDVSAELEILQVALSEKKVPKALEHAKAVLRLVG